MYKCIYLAPVTPRIFAYLYINMIYTCININVCTWIYKNVKIGVYTHVPICLHVHIKMCISTYIKIQQTSQEQPYCQS